MEKIYIPKFILIPEIWILFMNGEQRNLIEKGMRTITIKDSMKKGTVEMLILSFLTEGDMYGYQMSQLIKERAEGILKFPEGTLYPALYRLTGEEFITSYEKKVGKRLTRVYYHMEEKGLEYLNYIIDEYMNITEGVCKILFYKERNEEVKNGFVALAARPVFQRNQEESAEKLPYPKGLNERFEF